MESEQIIDIDRNNIFLQQNGTLDCKLHSYPKFYNHVLLKNAGTFCYWLVIGWFQSMTISVQTVKPTNIYRMDNFVYHNYG